MQLISSVLEQDKHTQRDGSRYTRELHVDDTGNEYRFEYLSTEKMDINQIMLDRAVAINADLAKPPIIKSIYDDGIQIDELDAITSDLAAVPPDDKGTPETTILTWLKSKFGVATTAMASLFMGK